MNIDEQIAELDALLAQETDSITASAGTDHSVGSDDGRLCDNIIPTNSLPDDYLIDDEETDVVQAMQQLLLKHEDTQLHRVEDPDLVRCLDELRGLAHYNMADLYESGEVMECVGVDEEDNDVFKPIFRLTLKDITKLPRHISACIQSVKVTKTRGGDVVEVKMHDKHPALEKLMKYHGAYQKDNEQQRNDDNAGVMNLLMASIGSQGMPTIENNDA